MASTHSAQPTDQLARQVSSTVQRTPCARLLFWHEPELSRYRPDFLVHPDRGMHQGAAPGREPPGRQGEYLRQPPVALTRATERLFVSHQSDTPLTRRLTADPSLFTRHA